MAHLLETVFRLTMDFSVTINDEATTASEDDAAGLAARERRLLFALLQYDGDLLIDFLKKSVLTEMEVLDKDELEIRVMGSRMNEPALLAPVFDSLSEADANFFSHALTRGAYAVETEHFSECFKVRLKDANLAERRLVDRLPLNLKSVKKSQSRK